MAVDPIQQQLRAVVTDAIGRQLDALTEIDAESDVEADELAQRMTADQLVRDALAGGQFGAAAVSGMRSFTGGHTAQLVARLDTTLSFVVKVDRSPALVAEAHHLRHVATDPALPIATRLAFPRIYAVDDIGPIYGYLMENLEEFTTIAETLKGGDVDLCGRLLAEVWTVVLAPAYRATRRRRLVPNVVEDYFIRAEARLAHAVGLGLLPAGGVPLSFRSHGADVDLPYGWAPVVDAAQVRLHQVVPPFGTFVHGDPNPENILWREHPDGTLSIKLIDPKDWRTGDYLFDAAKIGHYLRITSPVEHHGIDVTVDSSPVAATITYDPTIFATHESLERYLLDQVAELAEDIDGADCEAWRERYELAVAANLLGIVGPRLERAEAGGCRADADLAWVAFAEGLRLLNR